MSKHELEPARSSSLWGWVVLLAALIGLFILVYPLLIAEQADDRDVQAVGKVVDDGVVTEPSNQPAP